MRISFLVILIAIGELMPSTDPGQVLLEARYTATAESDPEYAQGAIERHELPHREIERFVWLILVPAPADPTDWTRKLNEAVDPRFGSFRVEEASAEARRRVDSGEIALQK